MTGALGLRARLRRSSRAARIGVGIGEASASAGGVLAALGLLSRRRAARRRWRSTRAASTSAPASGSFIGGLIVERWDAAFAGAAAPFGLRGWQVAFLAVGLPGLLLALWVATLREPRARRARTASSAPAEPHPFREFARELRAVLPPFTLLHLVASARAGAAVAAQPRRRRR